jgi:phage terminase large subunit-like protein
MPMHLYEASAGEVWPTPEWGREQLAGRVAWCGFDLAAKFDLTSWCLIFPPSHPEGAVEVVWRFWLPEAGLDHLAKHLGDDRFDRWTAAGWIAATPGEVLDYEQVYTDIEHDHRTFRIRGGDCDQWSMYPVISEIGRRLGVEVERDLVPYASTYERMTPGMTELMALVRQERFHHHANPVAAYCFDCVEVRRAPYDPELIRPNKPERGATGKRIDAVPAAAMALSAWKNRGQQQPRRSAYEDGSGLMIV